MGRLPKFENDEARYKDYLLEFDPAELSRAMIFVAETIVSDVTFEPFHQVGDVQGLLGAAATLFHFVEAYERKSGTLDLPS